MTAPSTGYTELQEIQRQIDNVLNESLLTSQRMVRLSHKTETIGIKTFTALGNQKEKLNRAQNRLTSVRSNLKSADANLNAIEKFDGTVSNVRKKSHKKYNPNPLKKSSTGTLHPTNVRKTNKPFVAPADGHAGRIAGGKIGEQTENNIEIVNSMLCNLKVMAKDLVTEVGVHEEQVKLLSEMVDLNQDHVTEATRRTNILRK